MKVPVARRQLLVRRGRTLAGVAGIAVALLLILALNGIVAGMESRITAILDRSRPDVVVAQAGVDTIHMSESTVDRSTADTVAAVPGVARVRPLSLVTTSVERGDARGMVYLVGEERAGSTIVPASGRAPGRGEIAIDRALAAKLGARVGSTVHARDVAARQRRAREDRVAHELRGDRPAQRDRRHARRRGRRQLHPRQHGPRREPRDGERPDQQRGGRR
jgi:putative ABC transport system permease protein